MAAHERETRGKCDPGPGDGAGAALLGEPDQATAESFTRLGTWGELSLIIALVLTVLYLFAYSHGNSKFSQPVKLQAQGWAQPREESKNWVQQHSMYAAKAAADEAEVLFYGDSVFELWRGTVHMEPDPRGHGVPEIFHRHFGQVYKTAVLAISGDATPHLMWRLLNGEAPMTLQSAKAAIVLVGSNDLTYASFQGDEFIPPAGNVTAGRIVAIAQHIHAAAPSAEILLLGLLPRGDQTLMPEPTMFEQPSKFTSTIAEVNTVLQAYARQRSRTQFLDCGARFVDAEGAAVNRELLPDALHPSAAGMEALAECVKPALQQMVGYK